MPDRGDDRFRPRVAPPRSKRAGSSRFVTRVLRSGSKAGTVRSGTQPKRGCGAKLGRGHVAAAFAGKGLNARSRRVVIKTRLVVLKAAGPRSTATHLRYIERDGVTKDGQPGEAYDAMRDRADIGAFEERGRGDRHQFRFIVSAEDAESIGDLHRFTRDLMGGMEADLGTRLDWVAVDHWDTDNPHTHVVLRGKDEAGRDLVIARDYISRGMRLRACELATEWLGPRTEQEIRRAQLREVDQERWTGLDRTLQQLAKDGVVERTALADRDDRLSLIGRLQRLTVLGLADEERPGCWWLRSDAESILRAMGERGDIVRTMQRTFGGERRDFVIADANTLHGSMIGRVAGKGLADELSERGYLIVDGLDGRAHYVALPASVDLAELPLGSVVETRADHAGRSIDRTIAAMTRDGVYSTRMHHEQLFRSTDAERNPDATLDAVVRRLEALRRAGVVERLSDGVWRVPENFIERAAALDRQRDDVSVTVRSAWPVERQVRAIGATWLDRQLLREKRTFSQVGFGAAVQAALQQRQQFLVEHELAEWKGGRFVPARNLLITLRARELNNAINIISVDSGLEHRLVVDGQRISGIYRRSVSLASGRFALVDDSVGFSLVPWRPAIERRLGQSVSGIVRSGDVSWDFSRQRGVGIG
jgi:type IV secretory pathway VirD2 relaxase